MFPFNILANAGFQGGGDSSKDQLGVTPNQKKNV